MSEFLNWLFGKSEKSNKNSGKKNDHIKQSVNRKLTESSKMLPVVTSNSEPNCSRAPSMYENLTEEPRQLPNKVMETMKQEEVKLNPEMMRKDEKQQHSKLPLLTKEMAEYTILILGNTGVGKSTFINAFANYIKYESLEDALWCGLHCPIPSIFTISDDNYETIDVKLGDWSGPKPKSAESVTQVCKAYHFPTPFGNVTLIDTPGTDDTNGIDQDKINCNKIVEYLRKFKQLSAVCIMLQANGGREDAAFQFCLKQLFLRLPKSFAANICFVFTHAQTSIVPWKVGNLGASVMNFTKMIAESESKTLIPFHHNCFSVDNEAIRYVAMKTNGIDIFHQKEKTYLESWYRSKEECIRLLSYVSTLKAQPTINVTFLNKALKIVTFLSEPPKEIVDKIGNLSEQKDLCVQLLKDHKTYLSILEQNRISNANNRHYRNSTKTVLLCKNSNCPKAGHPCVVNMDNGKSPRKSTEMFERCSDCGCHNQCHEIQLDLIQIEDGRIVAKINFHLGVIQHLNYEVEVLTGQFNKLEQFRHTFVNARDALVTYIKENSILLSQKLLEMVSALEKKGYCAESVTYAEVENQLKYLLEITEENTQFKIALDQLLTEPRTKIRTFAVALTQGNKQVK